MASKATGKSNVDWKKLVRTKYTQICKQKRHKRADEAKSAWDQNRLVDFKSAILLPHLIICNTSQDQYSNVCGRGGK